MSSMICCEQMSPSFHGSMLVKAGWGWGCGRLKGTVAEVSNSKETAPRSTSAAREDRKAHTVLLEPIDGRSGHVISIFV